MADDVKQLLLKVDASVELARKNLASLENSVSQFADNSDRSLKKGEAAFQRFERAGQSVRNLFAGLVGGLGLAAMTRGMASLADQANNIAGKLKLATNELGDYGQAQADVQRIASETRSAIGGTADLYSTLLRNGTALGATQEQVARATKTVAESFAVSGTEAGAAQGALVQLSQALASGVLRGDEFNSIVEASPRLMKLLADSLGVPTGKLRAMAAEGELTADKLFKALTDKKLTDELSRQFAQMPVTFGQAMTGIQNSAVVTFGQFDEGGQFSQAIAGFISRGSTGLSELAEDARQAGVDVRAAFSGLGDAFSPFLDGAKTVFGGIRVEVADTRTAIISLLQSIDSIANVVNRTLDHMNDNLAKMSFGTLGGPSSRDYGFRSNLAGRFAAGYDASARTSALDQQTRDMSRFNLKGSIESGADVGRAFMRAIGGGASAPPLALSGGSGGGKAAKAAKDSVDETAKFLAEVATKKLQDAYSAEKRLSSQGSLIGPGTGIVDLGASLEETQRALEKVREERKQSEDEIAAIQYRHINDLANFYEDAFSGRMGSIWDTFKQYGLRAVAEVLANLSSGQSAFSGAGGGILATLGGLFGGGRATGGPVDPSRFYMVGEKGPELFVPKVPGTIIPNGGMGGSSIHVSVDARGAGNPVEVEMAARRAVIAAAPTIIAAAQQSTIRTTNRPRL